MVGMFKIITLSAALEEKTINLFDLILTSEDVKKQKSNKKEASQ